MLFLRLPTSTLQLSCYTKALIGMLIIPDLNQNINLQPCLAALLIFKISWSKLENAICNRHKDV